jgi:hypothetical protein
MAEVVRPPMTISDPRNASAIELDMLEQLKMISLGMQNADKGRLYIIAKLEKVEDSFQSIPNMLYRLEQLEKKFEVIQEQAQQNTDFRIRYESSVATKRAIFGTIIGVVGGAVGAIITYLLNKGPH